MRQRKNQKTREKANKKKDSFVLVKLPKGAIAGSSYVLVSCKGSLNLNEKERINRRKKNIKEFREFVLPY